MSEDAKTPEREDLEHKATQLGIEFRSNISDEKLRERVNAALEDAKGAEDGEGENGNEGGAPAAATAPEPDGKETDAQRRVRKQKEASELVRVQVTCMNPNKREYDGEVLSAGNRVVGTHKKYIPFDTPWHVPRMIYNVLRDRECQVFVTTRDERGRQKREGRLIKEYNVTELDPLTKTELKELAQRQAMAQGRAA